MSESDDQPGPPTDELDLDHATLDLMAQADLKTRLIAISVRVKRIERDRKSFIRRCKIFGVVMAGVISLLTVAVVLLYSQRSDARKYYNDQIHTLVCFIPPESPTARALREKFNCGVYVRPKRGPGSAADQSSAAASAHAEAPPSSQGGLVGGRGSAPRSAPSTPQQGLVARGAPSAVRSSSRPRPSASTTPLPPSRPPSPTSVLPVCTRGSGLVSVVLRIVVPHC